jgi:hypothetical protein
MAKVSYLLLLNIMLTIYRYCSFIGKDSDQLIKNVSLGSLSTFFDWVLDQRRGKGGRRVCGIKSSSTLGTYWKIFRLIYEEANSEKIPPRLNRQMHRVTASLYDNKSILTSISLSGT